MTCGLPQAARSQKDASGDASAVVLVTGGSGLVGQALQEVVAEKGLDDGIRWVFVGSSSGDLTQREAAAALFADVRPTHVLHLAAKVGGLYANMKDNVGFWRSNMAMQVEFIPTCVTQVFVSNVRL